MPVVRFQNLMSFYLLCVILVTNFIVLLALVFGLSELSVWSTIENVQDFLAGAVRVNLLFLPHVLSSLTICKLF